MGMKLTIEAWGDPSVLATRKQDAFKKDCDAGEYFIWGHLGKGKQGMPLLDLSYSVHHLIIWNAAVKTQWT